MKPVKSIFDGIRPHFEKGGRFFRLYPFYEAIETIFYGLDHVTSQGPHVRDNLDVKRFMTIVIVVLIPHLMFGIYNTGYQARLAAGLPLDFLPVITFGLWVVMPMVMVTYAVGFFWEALFAVIRKHSISEGLFVTCMLFPLTLPPTIPLWQVAIGISFGVVIGKEVFGGTGRNFLNPALTGRAFIFFAYPAQMSGDKVWTAVSQVKDAAVDAVSGATPLAIATLVESPARVEQVLADSGYSFSKMFWGLYPGSIGSTSTFLCLVGALILMIVGIASYRIILGGILGILFTGGLLNFLAGGSSMAWMGMNPFYHLVMGGAAFGLAYMATDPVSAPDMENVKWIYGFLIGVLTVLIRVFNPAFPEGVMLAILFMNLFAPLLDYFAVKTFCKNRIPNV